MDSFTQMTQDWSSFFSALAQVSGGLVGLVFVALTFNARVLGAGGNPVLGTLARQTFGDFIMLLLVSLVMLTPHTSSLTVGLVLLSFVGVDTLVLASSLVRLRRHLRGPYGNREIVGRLFLSGVGHVMLGAFGYELIRVGASGAATGTLLFGGVITLLLSGCRSAWMLVMHQTRQ